MELDLPAKAMGGNPHAADKLRLGLKSCVAGRAAARDPWTFYEVIDRYLGPWGEQGYPLGYGKKYCVLFNTCEALKAEPAAVNWVNKTTVLLQEMLIGFIVARFIAGNLANLQERELRRFAFDSHSKAYLDGGLVELMLTNPRAIPIVATIPGAEFSPTSADFFSTWQQVFATIGMGIPRAAGLGLAAMMPVHSGLLKRAIDADRREGWGPRSPWAWALLRRLKENKADDLKVLSQIIQRLSSESLHPQDRYDAEEALRIARSRRSELAAMYVHLEKSTPQLGKWLDGYVPGWREF